MDPGQTFNDLCDNRRPKGARLIDGKTAKTDDGPAKLLAGRIRHFNLGVFVFQ
jgi:hypothetical protein